MEALLANVLNQENLAFVVKAMIALFAKDFVVVLFRKLAVRFKNDKHKGNDVLIEPLEAAAYVLDNVKFPGQKK